MQYIKLKRKAEEMDLFSKEDMEQRHVWLDDKSFINNSAVITYIFYRNPYESE
jgi:hypothetical protein